MTESVTLDLPESLVEHARAVAKRSHRRVEDILVEWLDQAATDVPVDLLSDEQVLALRDLQLDDVQQNELSNLLARQREDQLTAEERTRLDLILGNYRRAMVRKAHALKVAVERGLQPSLT